MTTLISKDPELLNKLAVALNESTSDLLKRDTKLIAAEFLTVERAIEQIELLKSEINRFEKYELKGKKLLEVGAGVGTFLIIARTKYGIDAYGVEPSKDEFSPFNQISLSLLQEYNLPNNMVICGNAEKLDFNDNIFDLIYSTNVLEHVQDPEKVLCESLRVLKPGGYLQFVIPNYFSFWEGHYGILWPCITNKLLGKIYARLTGQNPDYIDTLQLISPQFLKKILNRLSGNDFEVLDWGKEIFKKRLTSGNYSDWASLKTIRPLISFVQKSGLASFVSNVLNLFGMQTPIVLTIKKKG
jgi:SAM-dependent methyltransferase